ncbi:MAG: hypothetical protein M1825_006094 [Sarcosagium campestre]|nr:MAG: hypothetical protein M1825_006094 [Sarcosagium campestre]
MSSNNDGWAPPHPPPGSSVNHPPSTTTAGPAPSSAHHRHLDAQPQQQQRQQPNYGSVNMNPQVAQPVLPPPPQSAFYQSNSGSAHSLQPGSQGPGYALPALGSTIPHQGSRDQPGLDREREMREREMRERERQQYELSQRERELREREQRGQPQQPQPQPHQNHAGSIPIHQPVASKVPTAIHGPGGLLSGTGAGAGSGPVGPGASLGPPGGSSSLFGGALPLNEGPPRSVQPTSSSSGQIAPLPFANNAAPLSTVPSVPGIPQGQQPILNDALSYLDQVKVQFVDQPDVYNRFLDIMKDFKSQAIDTPGVIERVSTLFAGHPNLIQGFNTFLPPGYRIECGTGDDPNAIRVTTPMGTTVSSMGAAMGGNILGNGLPSTNGTSQPARHAPQYDHGQRNSQGSWQQAPQQPAGPPDAMFSPDGRPVASPMFVPHPGPSQPQGAVGDVSGHRDQQNVNAAAMAQHQQEQRGVSQLQNAITAAANGPQVRQSLAQGSPTAAQNQAAGATGPGGPAAPGPALGAQPPLEKRGPVEFNHAISYVNKIKNRFATQPEIYKQFLEILQTYQRESKPIQDVYAQVTQLFNAAPDLLEDFKQFLPESAAQAKAQAAAKQAAEDAAMLSNVRGESSYVNGTPTHAGQQGPSGHRSETKLPPLGKFEHPPSATKDNKKRKGTIMGQAGPAIQPPTMSVDASLGRPGLGPGTAANKRAKVHHSRAVLPDQPPLVSPTLTPALPEPLPPTTSTSATSEEFAFFDRVKKFIGNKQIMNEFLKLCNLFSQDLIDRNVLVSKAENFIGGNPDLAAWFKAFIHAQDQDEMLENAARMPSGKVALSNCRGYGPSYRLLPKRERLKQCSGRDEMCYKVLNDDWASHPTWASEDASFVAHRKNQYEESLHRIEEERHDYDFNIEANLRTIQLLEPIAQQIAGMTDEEKATFTLSPGIGGQSTAIYRRVIKKVYGDVGLNVVDELYAKPCAVVPVLLNRLKEKDEEWKSGRREWEKIWRDQTNRFFYRSLDHMGISGKNADKRQFTPKVLVSDVVAKAEEQRNRKSGVPGSYPKAHLEFAFDDEGVLVDATRLLLVFVRQSSSFNGGESQRIEAFVKEFVPRFFGLDVDKFEAGIVIASRRSTPPKDIEDSPTQSDGAGRGRRAGNGRKADLLRGVLQRARTGKSGRNDNDGTSASKESTPDVASTLDEELSGSAEKTPENGELSDTPDDSWTQHPAAGAARNTRPLTREIPRNEPYRRDAYTLYSNQTIYCFLRMFQILYERLSRIKESEGQVLEEVTRSKMQKAAHELGMIDKRPDTYFKDTSAEANYYQQILDLCQEAFEGTVDVNFFEDVLRHFYIQCGWQLYASDRLFSATARFAHNIVSGDVKDKSNEIIQLFYKDRDREETTHQNEISYRKHVEKLARDGDVFRVIFHQTTNKTSVQVLKKNDATFDEEGMSPESRWSYYVASYVKVEPTEGVPIDKRFNMPLLRRNVPEEAEDAEDSRRAVPHAYANQLEMRICVNSYHILWRPSSMDFFYHSRKERNATGGEGFQINVERAKERRKKGFEEKFVLNNAWRKEATPEELAEKDGAYQKLVATENGTVQEVEASTAGTADTDMGDS